MRGEVRGRELREPLVEHDDVGLTQPCLLDHGGRLVRNAAHVDDVTVRRELLEVADDTRDLVRDKYADHMRPPHTKCIGSHGTAS